MKMLNTDFVFTMEKKSYIAASSILITLPIVSWLYRRYFNRVASLKLPGPDIAPFIGDVFDFRRNKYQLHLLLNEYFKKYGNVFAFYHQGQPVIGVADEKIIHQILWKDFKSFKNRKFFIELPWPCQNMITMVTGDKAKVIRNLLKTLLDVSSIKNVTSHFQSAIDTVEETLKKAERKKEDFDAVSIAEGYIMEVLAKVTFSLDAPNQSELNKTLVKLSEKFTRPSTWINVVAALPLGRHLVKYIPGAYKNQLQPFMDIAMKLVTERRTNIEKKNKDILDALLNAQENNNDLLDEDLLAQGIVLLTAVHVATSTTIAVASYYIAKHMDVQKKLQQEIDCICHEEGFPSYDHVHGKLPYLDHVIKEVLRLYPSGFMLMRECTESCTIENINFKKGDAVLIPTYSIHRNNEIYENADEFNPDRFSKMKPSGSQYHPFGDGLRMCIGRQMALTEIKLYFTRLLHKFEISLNDEKQELNIRSHLTVQAMMAVEEPIKLRVTSRDRQPATP